MEKVDLSLTTVKFKWQCPTCHYWNVEQDDLGDKVECMKCTDVFIPIIEIRG